jgi:hypothetical protein
MSEPYKPVKPRVLKMYPPNIGRITRAIPYARKPGVIFTYGDTIYNPAGTTLPPELIAHEMVHIEQQHGVDPEVWWGMYLGDQRFRLGMEIPAHKAELDYLRVLKRPFMHVPARLIGPLYAGVLPHNLTTADALALLDGYSYGTMGQLNPAERQQDNQNQNNDTESAGRPRTPIG